VAIAAPSSAPAASNDPEIDSTELPPLESEDTPPADGAGPLADDHAKWLGLPLSEAERLAAEMPRPLGSPMLAALWRQLLKGGPKASADVLEFRARSLLEQGWAADASALLAPLTAAAPELAVLSAKAALATGDGSEACPILRRVPSAQAVELSKADRADFVSIAAFCAALTKDQTQAALAADVLREGGIERPVALAVLDSLSQGTELADANTGSLDVIDARLLGLVRPVGAAELGDRPSPLTVAALAADATRDPEGRAEALELAFQAHLAPASQIADAYAAIEIAPEVRQNPLAQDTEGTRKRAVLYQAAAEESAMLRKSRYIRAMLDETTRAGFGASAGALLAEAVAALPQVGEIGWFAESAVEILIAAGRPVVAAEWIERDRELDTTGGRLGLGHWLVLADVAGAFRESRQTTLAELEPAVRAGVFPPDVLQRLVTVLDALEYNVPIAVWEAAGGGLQSDSGELPETGLLTELQDAARAGNRPRTVLLAVLALAKGGPSGAHQLALGDAIRALKRVGMEREARQLAFEALYPLWPRRAGG
jgi:hypothetical protein